MHIRRAVYWQFGRPISLAYLPCLSEAHPEAVDDAPQPPPEPKAERAPAMTAGRIRKALGRDRAYSAKLRDRIGFEATVHRIEREGF